MRLAPAPCPVGAWRLRDVPGAVGPAPPRSTDTHPGLCPKPSLNPATWPNTAYSSKPKSNDPYPQRNLPPTPALRPGRQPGPARAEATANQLPHLQFLELLLQDELTCEPSASLERRKRRPVSATSNPWNTLTGVSTLPLNAVRSSIWPPASSSASARTFCCSGPPGWAKAFSPRPSATPPFVPASRSSTAPSFRTGVELQADQSPAEAQRTLTRYPQTRFARVSTISG